MIRAKHWNLGFSGELLLLGGSVAGLSNAQELSGTLKKVHDTGTVVLGYRAIIHSIFVSECARRTYRIFHRSWTRDRRRDEQ